MHPAGETSVRIPADVETPDKLLAGLTARQVAILAAVAAVLWFVFTATASFVPFPVFVAIAVPLGAAGAVLALGRRDGLPLDRLGLAAVQYARSPRRMVLAPEGVDAPPAWIRAQGDMPVPAPLRLPAQAISDDGVIDLGADGVVVVCAASTVSFALRTPGEQAALVGVFGRWLNSLSGPVQIVVRAEEVDVTPLVSGLRARVPSLPHPELEQAAIEHADFLADLARRRDLLRRQVLIVLREPRHTATAGLGHRSARSDAGAARRVLRRADEAVRALVSAGITVDVLNGPEATAALADCCSPWSATSSTASAQRATPADVITIAGEVSS